MGYDISVSRSLPSLLKMVKEEEIYLADTEAMLYDFIDGSRPDPEELFEAFSAYLGNVDGMARIQGVISEQCDRNSVLYYYFVAASLLDRRIIPLAKLDRMADELRRLKSETETVLVDAFRWRLLAAIEVAQAHGNPIEQL